MNICDSILRLVAVIFIINLLVSGLSFGQEAPIQDSESDSMDVVSSFPTKMSTHSTWEKVVSFPGTVAYLPFRLFFDGARETVRFVQEAPSLAPLRELFVPRIRIEGILPTASRRSGAGLKYYRNDMLGHGSRIMINFKHGFLDRRQKHYLEFRDLPISEGIFAYFKIQYRYLNRESFFGLGPESEFDDRSSYSLERTTADLKFGSQTHSNASARIYLGFENNGIFAGERGGVPSLTQVNNDSLPGLGTRIRLGALGLEMSLDTRDNRAITLSGWELYARTAFITELGGDQFEYWHFQMDVRRHFHLFFNRRLSIRMAAERNWPLNGKQVPFFNLSELGRRETIRGHSRGRYRAHDLLMGSLEYRFPIWHYFDWVLFLDGGQVSKDLIRRFEFGQFNLSYGGGFLIRSKAEPILQILIGRSEDQVRFYVVLN